MLMAGLDGIRNRIEPPDPIDKDLYELPPEEHAQIAQVPASLEGALDALAADHDYLTEGDVFTPDLIDTWITYKRQQEIDSLRQRPHPHEFSLYYDLYPPLRGTCSRARGGPATTPAARVRISRRTTAPPPPGSAGRRATNRPPDPRSEERRVGKECRSRRAECQGK